MKKVLSTIVAALVAISFAGIVCAADTSSDVKSESKTVTPAGETKTVKKEAKKSVKTKKGKKVKKSLKKDETTTEPAPAAK
jgi:hypothetical protein